MNTSYRFIASAAWTEGRHGVVRGEPGTARVPQVIENMVELVGIEPTTSSLRTMRSPS